MVKYYRKSRSVYGQKRFRKNKFMRKRTTFKRRRFVRSVRRIAINSNELKSIVNYNTGSVTGTGSVNVEITPTVSQGSARYERTGNRIFLKGFTVKTYYEYIGNATNAGTKIANIREIIYRQKGASAVGGIDLLDNDASAYLLVSTKVSGNVHFSRDRAFILEQHNYDPSTHAHAKTISSYVPINKVVNYDDSVATVREAWARIYLFFNNNVTPGDNNTINYKWFCKLYFRDV